MIGLDTNVLVCYLAQDDPAQSARATLFVERSLSPEYPGFVSIVAMAETVWVLERAYGVNGRSLAAVIERILQADALVVEHDHEVFTAMTAVRDRRAGFADALIAALGISAGCARTVTFDRRASRHAGFEML